MNDHLRMTNWSAITSAKLRRAGSWTKSKGICLNAPTAYWSAESPVVGQPREKDVDFGLKTWPCGDVTCPMCFEKMLEAGRCPCGFDALASIEKSARIIKNILLFWFWLAVAAAVLWLVAAIARN